MPSASMIIVVLLTMATIVVFNAECCYAENHEGEYHLNIVCFYALCHCAVFHYAEYCIVLLCRVTQC
jgi:hypothetical protein